MVHLAASVCCVLHRLVSWNLIPDSGREIIISHKYRKPTKNILLVQKNFMNLRPVSKIPSRNCCDNRKHKGIYL
jgi:hypothetical protein